MYLEGDHKTGLDRPGSKNGPKIHTILRNGYSIGHPMGQPTKKGVVHSETTHFENKNSYFAKKRKKKKEKKTKLVI